MTKEPTQDTKSRRIITKLDFGRSRLLVAAVVATSIGLATVAVPAPAHALPMSEAQCSGAIANMGGNWLLAEKAVTNSEFFRLYNNYLDWQSIASQDCGVNVGMPPLSPPNL